MSIEQTLAAIQASQPDMQLSEQPKPSAPQTAPQQVEQRGPSRSTPDVLKDAIPRCAAIRTALAALPDEKRLAIPAEREEVWDKRRLLNAYLTMIMPPLEGRVAKLDARLADRKHQRTLLKAAQLDLEKALAAVEDAMKAPVTDADVDRKNFRLDEALRVLLRMIQNGDDPEAMFAGPLMSWLHKNGYRPEIGAANFFTGFRGLLSLDAEITEIEKERDEYIAGVETALAQAKLLLDEMNVTTA